ncbi:MAG: efflux RND transporter periplasmic adaptor subunit [Planctomycetes bacterium]|nr:efflux RND transporter periplasmic adaptor subunit [Planctomycetota bacterium]
MKRIIVLVVFGLVLLAGVMAVLNAMFTPVEIEVGIVKTGKAMETVYATGHVEAREQRTLRAQRAGVIAEIYNSPATGKSFTEGDVVHAGDPILRLRDSALSARRDGAQAELTRVTEQVKEDSPYRQAYELRIGEARNTAEDARAREQRLKAQLETGGISRDAYDQAKTRADVAEQQLHQLKQEFEQVIEDLQAARTRAQAELDTINAAEQDDMFTAPIDGVILTLPLEAGEFASVGTELVKVGDLRDMILEAEVNEDDIGRVNGNAGVNIRLAGFEDTNIQGEVYEILPDADRTTKGFTIKVRFLNASLVANREEPLKGVIELESGARPLSGMTAELGIVVAERDGAMTIPRPALTPQNTVFVVGDNNKVSEVKVTIGLINFSTCEITSGLSVGDEVAISNLKDLADGTRVKKKQK